jgi:hypothetical protein
VRVQATARILPPPARGIARAALLAASMLTLPALGPTGIEQAFAQAQRPVPSPMEVEVLVKAALLQFNDANLSDNYDVMYALMSEESKKTGSVQRLREAFADFRDRKIDISVVAALQPTLTDPVGYDNVGALSVAGYFDDPMGNRIVFTLRYMIRNDDARLHGITVNVVPKAG